uniref:Double-GTPase 2 domain-containing protein n=1 Tax=Candidatus Kentrum sp. MB TaxID=2138164 RepID=A0A450XFR2_9GAMM|nr:MAG: hypothetical protein BECKMB1821G_GA0114241_10336 [Candidatus Kentron sp. MB]
MPTTSPSTHDTAIKSYFFGKGYQDLWATITDAFKRNWNSSTTYWTKCADALGEVSDEWWKIFPVVFWFGAALSVMVFGTTLTLILSSLHIVILGLFFGIIYIGFSFVSLFERAAMLIRGFVFVCPACHLRLGLPTYLCKSCGREHPRLIPSSFGILWHRCRCGEKLPCTLFSNRGRLPSKCLECGAMLKRAHTETRKQFLPIIGGPAVGKSAYLVALCRHLREVTAPSMGMEAEFVTKTQEQAYEQVISGIDSGQAPSKTVETLPRAFDLIFCRSGRSVLTTYLYDPAGDAFFNSNELILHKFLEYLSGILFLVDPFVIPVVRDRYAAELSAEPAVRPNVPLILPEEALTRLINVMEAQFGLAPDQRIKAPLAVVINKVDAFDLEKEIGEAALAAVPRQPRESNEAHRDRVIQDRLKAWGQTPFVHMVETRFSTVRYYTVSALGRSPDGTNVAFQPLRVEEPALWILSQSNRMWSGKSPLSWWPKVLAAIVFVGIVAAAIPFLYQRISSPLPEESVLQGHNARKHDTRVSASTGLGAREDNLERSAVFPHIQPLAASSQVQEFFSRTHGLIEKTLQAAMQGDDLKVQSLREAIIDIKKPLRGHRKKARRLNRMGIEHIRSKEYTQATVHFRVAHEADSADIEIANNLGYALLMAGNLLEAKTALFYTLSLAPDRANGWSNLGEVYAREGELQRSKACFRNVILYSRNPPKTRKYLVRLAATNKENLILAVAIKEVLAETN